MNAHTLKSKFVRRIYRFLITVYYDILFGRRVPFAGKLAELVGSWEAQHNTGSIPQPREVWDYQYQGGKWNYMSEMDELARYSVIAGYLYHLKQGGAILDVGCGEGILLRRLGPTNYSKYVGIDLSQAAIDKASQWQNEQVQFLRADVESYTPTELFDVIVFNESLYYFQQPLGVVERYVQALKEGGIFVVSTYMSAKRAVSILERLKESYRLLDEVKTIHQDVSCSKTFTCSVFSPSA